MKFKVIISVLVALIIGFLVYQQFFNAKKTGFINISVLYDDFEYKKELEQKHESISLQRQNVLDSLKLEIDLLAGRIESGYKNDSLLNTYRMMIESYKYKEKQFYQDNQTLSNQYMEDIFNQLNQYVEDYGKQNNYLYIHGANNNGALMYADDSEDITQEVLVYVNNKYQGKTE